MKKTTREQTQALRDAIFRTFNELQEDDRPYSLVNWARENPKDFYTGLLPRVIPKPVELSASEGVSFALVYQVGDQRLIIGQDGKLLPLPEEQPPPLPEEPTCFGSRMPGEEIIDLSDS